MPVKINKGIVGVGNNGVIETTTTSSWMPTVTRVDGFAISSTQATPISSSHNGSVSNRLNGNGALAPVNTHCFIAAISSVVVAGLILGAFAAV